MVVLAVAMLGVTGCQTARAGQKCRSGAAQDKTHVLICKNGRWVRWVTKTRARQLLVAYANSRSTPAGWWEPGTCITNVNSGLVYRDVRYNGPLGTAGNAATFSSADRSCTGASQPITVVRSQDSPNANAQCASLDTDSAGSFRLRDNGWPTAPPDAFACLQLAR